MKCGDIVRFEGYNDKKHRKTTKTGVIINVNKDNITIKSGRKTYTRKKSELK